MCRSINNCAMAGHIIHRMYERKLTTLLNRKGAKNVYSLTFLRKRTRNISTGHEYPDPKIIVPFIFAPVNVSWKYYERNK